MPRFAGKKVDKGVPVTIDKDRYMEGDVVSSMEGSVVLGEKPGNVAFPIQIDASGYLKVNLVAGGYAQHEYQDGDVNTGAYGHLCLGDDGANLQAVKVGTNGRLQVEVVVGNYDAVQYQDGAAVASPFGYVTMGHDGSNVFPVVVDSSGYLQVDIRILPTDTFAAEGQALGKGVLIQGDDGTDRHNVVVDASGHIQTDIVGSLPAGSAAIGKLAPNSGVDIGDVDVKSLPTDTFAAGGQAHGKGVLIQGDDGFDRHNISVDGGGRLQIDIVDEPKASVFNSVADVSLPATATTQIVGSLATRLCVLISSKKSNTATIRIGDSNTGVSRGIELAPGQSISIETTEAIYGHNPAAVAVFVSVILTED